MALFTLSTHLVFGNRDLGSGPIGGRYAALDGLATLSLGYYTDYRLDKHRWPSGW